MKKTLLSLPLLLLGTNLVSQSVTNGLIAAYNFNTGKPYDQIVPKANATSNISTYMNDHYGNVGMAYTFNNGGTTTYSVNCSNASKFNVTTGLTISAWVYLNNSSTEKAIVAKWAGSQTQDQFILMTNSANKVLFAVGTPSASASGIASNGTLTSSNWHHIVATWDNTGTHKIYINGALDKTSTLTNFTTINSTASLPLFIGKSGDNFAPRLMNGSVDDVLLYNRALSLSEIQQIFNETNPIIGGLVSHYPFDLMTSGSEDMINYNSATGSVFYTTDRNGNFNSALNIDATSSYLNLHDTYDNFSAVSTGQMAYSFWINFKTLNNSYRMIIAKSADSGCSLDERQFLLRINSQNKLEVAGFATLSPNNNRSAIGSTTFTTGTWHHVVLNYNQAYTGINKFNMWVDGAVETLSLTTQTGTGFNTGWQDGPACIGIGAYLKNDGNMCVNTQRLDAYFDDLKIFNKELTPVEIATLAGVTTGVSESSASQNLFVFPNPANNILNIDSKKVMDVNIVNLLGETIQTQLLNKGANQINISPLTSGIYFLKAENGAAIRFIKE